ncbi:MAG: polysaccharide pyruvyl transferase family protein [Methanocella sp.]
MIQKRDFMPTIISTIKTTYYSDADTICAFWWESKNWGDALNPVLIQLLSGKRPIIINKYTLNIRRRPVYAVIGSILDSIPDRSIKNTIIWGPGFIQKSGKLPGEPGQVCAVRGPLSRDNIIKQGIKCPDVFGDPALLYPRFYKPDIHTRHLLGIIPHYKDKENENVRRFKNLPEVKIIDIENSINNVIDQVCSCRYIASSSLHGIIMADAYKIPSTWLEFSEGVAGSGFKFRDYFASVGKTDVTPLKVDNKTTIDDIISSMYNKKINIDLDELIDACPFYSKDN